MVPSILGCSGAYDARFELTFFAERADLPDPGPARFNFCFEGILRGSLSSHFYKINNELLC